MTSEAAFRSQAEHCADLGSPFTARLMRLAADRLSDATAVGEHLLRWRGNASHRADAVPLRLAGALHALARARRAELADVYPPHHASTDDDVLWGAVEKALQTEEAFILEWVESPPQTNEVRRLNALYPGLLTVAEQTGLPLVTSEIGASAGLNMAWDHYAFDLGGLRFGDPTSKVFLQPDWRGALPPRVFIKSLEAKGCDLNPLDVREASTEVRLMAYIWADQYDRMERTRAAIEIARTNQIEVTKGDALDWLRLRLENERVGVTHVVYHSIVWQYLSADAQRLGTSWIGAAGDRAHREAPLAWLRMESDGKAPGGAITLTLWPGGREVLLGRADFHGRWIEWRGWS